MTKQWDDDDVAREAAKKPAEDDVPQGETAAAGPSYHRQGRWLDKSTPFVAPITMVPVDPPRPLNRRRPEGA